jgi:hypothetical protein
MTGLKRLSGAQLDASGANVERPTGLHPAGTVSGRGRLPAATGRADTVRGAIVGCGFGFLFGFTRSADARKG